MDGAQALRTARRRLGRSQRELALRAGVSASTVAAIESGGRTASLATLAALLETAGLELTVDYRVPGVSAQGWEYLHLPLPTRVGWRSRGKVSLPPHPIAPGTSS